MATLTRPLAAIHAPRPWWLKYLAVAGPGLIVAFADTEAGSVTIAATSGAQFGMKLVLLQLLLIVPLFVIQEMTVRLGTVSGRGHAALIRDHYGLGWAWVSLGTMLVTNFAALVTEFIGIAGAAMIFGISPVVLVARRRDAADRCRVQRPLQARRVLCACAVPLGVACSFRRRSPRIRRFHRSCTRGSSVRSRWAIATT